jgi:hypothetical protein
MCNTTKRLALFVALALMPASSAFAQTEDAAAAPDALRRELDELKKELDGLRQDIARSFQAAKKDIDSLAEQVANLRKEMEDLRKQQQQSPPPTTRSSRLAPTPSYGTIRLINAYVEPVQIVVNESTYRLAPGETRLLRGQVPGPFTYEVSGIKPAVERVLAANEIFTIRVYPR